MDLCTEKSQRKWGFFISFSLSLFFFFFCQRLCGSAYGGVTKKTEEDFFCSSIKAVVDLCTKEREVKRSPFLPLCGSAYGGDREDGSCALGFGVLSSPV